MRSRLPWERVLLMASSALTKREPPLTVTLALVPSALAWAHGVGEAAPIEIPLGDARGLASDFRS
jgi:hypothetical protein